MAAADPESPNASPAAPAPRTFSNLAKRLDSALAQVTQARADVETTTAAAVAAQDTLQKAVAGARALQDEFRAQINDVIGDPSAGRVRVS